MEIDPKLLETLAGHLQAAQDAQGDEAEAKAKAAARQPKLAGGLVAVVLAIGGGVVTFLESTAAAEVQKHEESTHEGIGQQLSDHRQDLTRHKLDFSAHKTESTRLAERTATRVEWQFLQLRWQSDLAKCARARRRNCDDLHPRPDRLDEIEAALIGGK